MPPKQDGSVSAALLALLSQDIHRADGWLPFDAFMALVLYSPGLGYYSRGHLPFGVLPQDGSDFVTAPELSPLFAQALSRQVQQLCEASESRLVWEFGAGSGALAEGLLAHLGEGCEYRIVEVSGSLRAAQMQRLSRFGQRVQWLEHWPDSIEGVVLGNEVLDAMPVKLAVFDGQCWRERGVSVDDSGSLRYADQHAEWTDLGLPSESLPSPYLTEVPVQALAFVRSLAQRLQRGAALFIDYGFPQAEFLHPQRHMGTLMCHRGHQNDGDALSDLGLKDITTHVNFSAVALAAQDSGCDILGYTSQGRFLLNCGLADGLAAAAPAARANAHKLVAEHEMGELFKALLFAKGWDTSRFTPLGFASGDRTHRL